MMDKPGCAAHRRGGAEDGRGTGHRAPRERCVPAWPTLRKISVQGTSMPALREHARAVEERAGIRAGIAGHSRPQHRSRSGCGRRMRVRSAPAAPSAVAGSSPMVRAEASASSCIRRRVSRAMVPPSCTRAVPWLSATCRSRSPAYSDRPPATISTIDDFTARQPPAQARRRRVDSQPLEQLVRAATAAVASAPLVSAPLYQGLDDQRHHRQQGQERRHGEGADGVVLAVEDLDMQG